MLALLQIDLVRVGAVDFPQHIYQEPVCVCGLRGYDQYHLVLERVLERVRFRSGSIIFREGDALVFTCLEEKVTLVAGDDEVHVPMQVRGAIRILARALAERTK